MTRWIPSVLAVVWVLLLAACAPPTYINIPPEGGDVAFSNPNAKDVQQIMVVAVARSLQTEPLEGPYVVVLPDRSSPRTYAVVTDLLGLDAHRPASVPAYVDPKVAKQQAKAAEKAEKAGEEPPVVIVEEDIDVSDLPVVTVKSIRIRSGTGQVDLVRPSLSGRRLTTVYLDWEVGFGWAADRVRSWRVDPQAQPEPVGPANPHAGEKPSS